ncbi:MAG TPA: DUF481 domain-containing protein [Tepidisphaeraceae bacterium]|jgi:putative salt-induced outer membrane protein YdiY
MTSRIRTVATAVILCALVPVRADQIVFKNGDKITGKIETMDGGKMKITSAVAGEIIVDMKDVATFSTDAPIEIKTAEGKKINEPVTATTEPDQVKTASGEVVPLPGVSKINPPPEKWTGNVLVNGSIARGNTDTDDLGISALAVLRRDNDVDNDRFTLSGGYNFGRQRIPGTGDKVTSTDNWNALGKYDKFLTDKIYVYGLFKVEHDRIADLNYRLSPGVGVGYQWYERDDFHLSTEAGISYVYEDFISDGTNEHLAGRLAYHIDRKMNDTVTLFSNGEWLPAFEDPSDYNLTADAGIRADITKVLFSEFKVEWKRDSSPAPGAEKNDLRYILGIGWKF